MIASVTDVTPEVEPVLEFTLTMTEEEARRLYELSGMDLTIPRAVCYTESRTNPEFVAVGNLLKGIHRSLGPALRSGKRSW